MFEMLKYMQQAESTFLSQIEPLILVNNGVLKTLQGPKNLNLQGSKVRITESKYQMFKTEVWSNYIVNLGLKISQALQ